MPSPDLRIILPLMRMILTLIAALFLVSASPPPPKNIVAKPALWKVSDADTTIYLFGTIHILKPGVTWLDGPVKSAFDGSEQLVLELVEPGQDESSRIIMSKAIDPDGPLLTAKLAPEDAARYRATLTQLGIAPLSFEVMEPWFASVMITLLPIQKLGFDPEMGVEKSLTRAAKARNMPVLGLETMEEQIGFFDGLPEKAQIAMLNASVRDAGQLRKFADKMVKIWAKGNPDALGALLNDDIDDTPELTQVLLVDRNRRWADWIRNRLEKPGTVFLAVGAAHLAGPDSVQHYLAAQKIKAVRIDRARR